jgi:hypothetical protein
MLKRTLIVFALLIGVVHVMGVYFMPNTTHKPLSKDKLYVLKTLTHKHADTASETPYKVKFRSFFCAFGEKKVSVAVATFKNLIVGCLTFKLSEFLQGCVRNIFHFNLSYLRTSPELVVNKCCWLI